MTAGELLHMLVHKPDTYKEEIRNKLKNFDMAKKGKAGFVQRKSFEELLWSEINAEERKFCESNIAKVNVWLKRGDGVAVYENQNLSSPMAGHNQFISFGSKAAQVTGEEPPDRMPDLGRSNWAYYLVGTYRGEPLPENLEEDLN